MSSGGPLLAARSMFTSLGGTRRCYYRLVATGLIPHTAATYRRLSSRLAQARWEEGFPDLVDPLREVHVPPAWPDAGALSAGNPGENDLARVHPRPGAFNNLTCEHRPSGRDALKLFNENITAWKVVRR